LIFTDCQFQYTLAKPIHSLIVVASQHFEEFKQRFVMSQRQQEVREKLEKLFSFLVEQMDTSLDSRSREKFTQKLVSFSHSVKNLLSPS